MQAFVLEKKVDNKYFNYTHKSSVAKYFKKTFSFTIESDIIYFCLYEKPLFCPDNSYAIRITNKNKPFSI